MGASDRTGTGGQGVRRLLTSPRLALGLLILIALLSTSGSLLPAEVAADAPHWVRRFARILGLLDTFRSPLFLALVGLLSVSVAWCTAERFARRRRAAPAPAASPLLPWADAGVHVSLLVIVLGGALKATLGFLGTQYLVVGVPTNTVYSWRDGRDVGLDFAVIARERVEEYHPALARIGVRDASTGEKLALVELVEDRPAAAPGQGLELELLGIDRERGVIRLRVSGEGAGQVVELATEPGTAPEPAVVGRRSYTLVAYRHDIRKVRARLEFIERGETVREAWIEPNSRVSHGGMSLFQTSWGADDQDRPFVGVQFSRDPGAPVFWAGCILLGLTLPLLLVVRRRPRGPRPGEPREGT